MLTYYWDKIKKNAEVLTESFAEAKAEVEDWWQEMQATTLRLKRGFPSITGRDRTLHVLQNYVTETVRGVLRFLLALARLIGYGITLGVLVGLFRLVV